MERIFELKIDLTQNIDEIPNVHKFSSNDYADISNLLNSEKYKFPEPEIVVKGNFLQLDKLDFISNDLNIPIFSKRFIEKITKIKDIKLNIIPLKIYDDTEQIKEPRIDFYTIDFQEQLNILNLDKSEFRKLRSKPEEKGVLKNVILNPQNSFPCIFRVKESISKLFVSETLLNSTSLKGANYVEVKIE